MHVLCTKGSFWGERLWRPKWLHRLDLLSAAGEGALPYLHATAQVALDGMREEFAGILALGAAPVVVEEAEARWWTFAGGRANQALAAAVGLLSGWKAMADNWRVRIEGTDVAAGSVGEVLERLRQPEFWADPVLARALLERLPQYRLSKFQAALPEAAVREMVGAYLVDLVGAGRVVDVAQVIG